MTREKAGLILVSLTTVRLKTEFGTDPGDMPSASHDMSLRPHDCSADMISASDYLGAQIALLCMHTMMRPHMETQY